MASNSYFDHDVEDNVGVAMRINSLLNAKKSKPSSIGSISPYTPIKYNSVNVAIGRRSFGKTFVFNEEFIRIARDSPRTHLLVRVIKDKNVIDPTFEQQKEFIDLPIEYVSVDDVDDYIKTLIKFKNYYEQIIEQGKVELVMNDYPDVMEQIETVLHVDNFNIQGLHTLISIDDAVNAKILQPKSYITSLLSENRQPRLSFFISVQFWKGIIPSIKPNINCIFLFGTYSRQQIGYILQQIPIPMTFNQFMDEYKTLQRHYDDDGNFIGSDYIIFDCDTGQMKVKRVN